MTDWLKPHPDSLPRRGTVLTVRVPLDCKSVPDLAADASPTTLDNRSAA